MSTGPYYVDLAPMVIWQLSSTDKVLLMLERCLKWYQLWYNLLLELINIIVLKSVAQFLIQHQGSLSNFALVLVLYLAQCQAPRWSRLPSEPVSVLWNSTQLLVLSVSISYFINIQSIVSHYSFVVSYYNVISWGLGIGLSSSNFVSCCISFQIHSYHVSTLTNVGDSHFLKFILCSTILPINT